MPELRKDPIVGALGDHRARAGEASPRLQGRSPGAAPDAAGPLPVLRGPRGQDPPRDPRLPRARHPSRTGRAGVIRVVPNKFPALKVEGQLNKRGDGIYDLMAGVGAHEVIIESPEAQHQPDQRCPTTTSAKSSGSTATASSTSRSDKRLVHGILFKNVGAAAGGASLEHTHSQLIVTPIVPDHRSGRR